MEPFARLRDAEPVSVVIREVGDAELAKDRASWLATLYMAGVMDGRELGLGDDCYLIGDREVIFAHGGYVVTVTILVEMENRLSFALDLARRIYAALDVQAESRQP